MKILGIRSAPQTIRYAVLDFDEKLVSFLNSDGENKLDFPNDCQTIENRLFWFYMELERILLHFKEIKKIAIKVREYGNKETKKSRENAYFDGVILLIAAQKSIPVMIMNYKLIGTRRNEVKSYVQEKVGISSKYWNEQMADAVAAAWSIKDK